MAVALREPPGKGRYLDVVTTSTRQLLHKIPTEPGVLTTFLVMNGEVTDEQTNLFCDTTGIQSVRSQSLDADFFPFEFRLVYVSETSGRKSLSSIRDIFARNKVGRREDLTVAACTLQSA